MTCKLTCSTEDVLRVTKTFPYRSLLDQAEYLGEIRPAIERLGPTLSERNPDLLRAALIYPLEVLPLPPSCRFKLSLETRTAEAAARELWGDSDLRDVWWEEVRRQVMLHRFRTWENILQTVQGCACSLRGAPCCRGLAPRGQALLQMPPWCNLDCNGTRAAAIFKVCGRPRKQFHLSEDMDFLLSHCEPGFHQSCKTLANVYSIQEHLSMEEKLIHGRDPIFTPVDVGRDPKRDGDLALLCATMRADARPDMEFDILWAGKWGFRMLPSSAPETTTASATATPIVRVNAKTKQPHIVPAPRPKESQAVWIAAPPSQAPGAQLWWCANRGTLESPPKVGFPDLHAYVACLTPTMQIMASYMMFLQRPATAAESLTFKQMFEGSTLTGTGKNYNGVYSIFCLLGLHSRLNY